MRHPKTIQWEKKLRKVFDAIDEALEQKYGALYPLHPSRAKKGTTGNKKHDGLFRVGAAFSAGFGSKHGAGYIVDVDMITLSQVPQNVLRKIEDDTASMLEESLPKAFPNKKLDVERDGNTYKIFGDLSLGEV